MACLIDTTVLIDLERQGIAWSQFAARTLGDEPFAIAAITVSELLAGIYWADTEERRKSRESHVEGLIESIPILDFDLAAARIHARLWQQLTITGQRIGPNDLLIAATALSWSHAVLTSNVREFERIPGLTVRQPAW